MPSPDNSDACVPALPSAVQPEPGAMESPAAGAVVASERMLKVPATVLKTLAGLEGLDDSLLVGKSLRQLAQGQNDTQGKDVSGFFVVADAGAAVLFSYKTAGIQWTKNTNQVNKEIAPSLAYIESGHTSGGQLAVVNSLDLIKLLMTHPKMKAFAAEGAMAYVQRETGAVGGIARAVQAATAPSEGQRVLQAGFDGAIAEGGSRTEHTTMTDADGRQTVQRLVERGVLLPDGQGVQVQQAQSVVEGGVRTDFDGLIHNMTHMVNAITTSAEFMGKMRQDMCSIEKRVLSLEDSAKQGHAKKARASKKQETWNRTTHPELPKNILFRDGSFGWKKTHKKQYFSKYGFATMQEAMQNLAGFQLGRFSQD